MKKDFFFASPGSTVAPSSCKSPGFFSSPNSDTDYVLEYRLPLRADEQDTCAATKVLMPAGSFDKRSVFKITFSVSLLTAVVTSLCCLYASTASTHPSTTPKQPRIWNPNLPHEYLTEPLAKSVIRRFDAYNMARGGRDDAATFRANVEMYMEPDLLYESVGFGTWSTPAGWDMGEEMHYGMAFPETMFTQMLFFGDEQVATTTTYGSALWGGDLFGIQAPQKWVTLRITDFYYIRQDASQHGRIAYNFMMIDWVDALRQIGRHMLPQAPLPEGTVLPPAANDGVPAPLSTLMQAQGRDAKAARAVAEAALQQDWTGSGDSVQHWHDDLTYYGPGGIGLARNLNDYTKHILGPFRAAFEKRTAFVELSACEGNYCGLFGRLSGRGVGKWLGLPTTGQDVSFRFAMHYRIVDDKIQEGWAIFDFPGLFAELGFDFYALAAEGGRYVEAAAH
eukprot:gnl/TRDRNA2_/TRDRNA2_30537_c0_seq1.p1 gnl/TRDRNA2_/TRDRNA2_30537_c0~~gnl/TRDRNA2_/TRDRNA2_30537_c0_seq1.p1  ORF type:complete len:450 (+),score=81.74 gnl/TRDRNA2_/TRDRNA2_30537_c0_seq1:61-1410(+)